MASKFIKGKIFNSLGNIQTVRISRSKLYSYYKTPTTYKGKRVWVSSKNFSNLKDKVSIVKKGKKIFGLNIKKGKDSLGRKWVRYYFKMRKMSLISDEDVLKIIKKCKSHYKKIKNLNKSYGGQRMWIRVVPIDMPKSTYKSFIDMVHYKTGKKFRKIVTKKPLISQGIGTKFMERNKINDEVIFEELEQKIFNFLNNIMAYGSVSEYDDFIVLEYATEFRQLGGGY